MDKHLFSFGVKKKPHTWTAIFIARQLEMSCQGLQTGDLRHSQFEEERDQIHQEIEIMKEISENHGNHFAMVENFVEKFIPIRIQSQISETLHDLYLSNLDKIKRLVSFEKAKFLEMHQCILDDDGIPNIIKQMKEIKFNVNDIYKVNYEGPKIANANREKIIDRIKEQKKMLLQKLEEGPQIG